MNTLFLNPPFLPKFSRESRSPAVTKSGTLYYPKWLCYAAGFAEKRGHKIHIIDAPANNYSTDYVKDYIEKKQIEAVVMDTSTLSIINDVTVLDSIVQKHSIPILLVGRHVSAIPDETFTLSESISYIAVREYEETVCDWLHCLSGGEEQNLSLVDGLVWKKQDGSIIQNKPRNPVQDLDSLPFVSDIYKRFLNVDNYFYGHSLYPLVVFDTSRGCPYQCSFCAYPQTFSGHKMRYRSIENVADEFEYIKNELPTVKSIMLEDDTFIIDKKRTLKLAEELIKRNNSIPFDSNCRADINEDLAFFTTLKKAGARLFCVGFESGDDTVLNHMKKKLNLSKTEKFIKMCKKAKIKVHGCFMVGNLNETTETLHKTLDLALKLKPDTAQFYPIMVYPGTAAYEDAKAKGYLQTEDFSKWLTEDGLHNSVVNLPHITAKELVEFCDYARKKFYLNPSYIMRKLAQSLTNFNELKRNLKGFKTLIGYIFRGTFGKKNR